MAERSHIVKTSTIIWAIRYCLSRRTYAFGDGLDLILAHWGELDEDAQEIVWRDLKGRMGNAPNGYENRIQRLLNMIGKSDEVSQ